MCVSSSSLPQSLDAGFALFEKGLKLLTLSQKIAFKAILFGQWQGSSFDGKGEYGKTFLVVFH